LFFDCKIGDFKIAGCVCLQKKFIYLLSYKVFFGCTCNIVYTKKELQITILNFYISSFKNTYSTEKIRSGDYYFT